MLVVGVAPPWQPSCPKCILSLPRLVMDACLPHGMRLWVTISTVNCADDQGVGFFGSAFSTIQLVTQLAFFSTNNGFRAPAPRCTCCGARRAVVCNLPSAGGVAAVRWLQGDVLLQQEVPEDPLETQRAQAGVQRAASASGGGGTVGSTGFGCSR